MQGRLYRNIQNRTIYKKYELQKRLYKYLIHHKQLELEESTQVMLYKKQYLIPKNSSKTKIRNLCFLTEKARSVSRDFRLNRNMIKRLSSKKLLQGVKRASW